MLLPLRHLFSPSIFELENRLILAHKADLGEGLKVSVLDFTGGHICGRKAGQASLGLSIKQWPHGLEGGWAGGQGRRCTNGCMGRRVGTWVNERIDE